MKRFYLLFLISLFSVLISYAQVGEYRKVSIVPTWL